MSDVETGQVHLLLASPCSPCLSASRRRGKADAPPCISSPQQPAPDLPANTRGRSGFTAPALRESRPHQQPALSQATGPRSHRASAPGSSLCSQAARATCLWGPLSPQGPTDGPASFRGQMGHSDSLAFWSQGIPVWGSMGSSCDYCPCTTAKENVRDSRAPDLFLLMGREGRIFSSPVKRDFLVNTLLLPAHSHALFPHHGHPSPALAVSTPCPQ